eukprot:CAMPEP_0175153036 /NCGR_PEP_ID=MMETSP0087-20121206/19487_1 /TAXON_ID=136419 /ORGANISM="Unknown Unknown, Strain D1" /LENGTH=94 /DNA_ID=CAMNT_0016439617 /DNA_START=368 /DNA_END=652 /DNA_ORIENTATION=-
MHLLSDRSCAVGVEEEARQRGDGFVEVTGQAGMVQTVLYKVEAASGLQNSQDLLQRCFALFTLHSAQAVAAHDGQLGIGWNAFERCEERAVSGI